MLVRARFSNVERTAMSRWLEFVLDTGATKSVLFEPAFSESVDATRTWRSLKGLIAPTLLGASAARLVLAPAVELEASDGKSPVLRTDVDCAAVETSIGITISGAVHRPVSGLLGYSFFRGGCLGLDFTNGVVWIDPAKHAHSRRYEYSQVGIQLERSGDRVLVLGVVEDSPAAEAGIQIGDELKSIGGRATQPGDITRLAAALEGPPGTRVRLVMARRGSARPYVLTRRRLL
jgi:membrane-associated protease RseP (regulator of RpoE activity)